MQKGEKNKLKLLLIGIQARLKQNRDYFVSAEFIFKSGNKRFKAALKAGEENDYLLVFQGTERPIDAEEVVSFFDKQTELYDDSTLVYTERGTVITITVNAKGVSMKQTEQQAAPQDAAAVNNPLLDHSRKYLIQADKAAPLLREIGILTADGKIKNDMIRKYNQIDHYVELVAPMFEQDDSEEILLLDCACGSLICPLS